MLLYHPNDLTDGPCRDWDTYAWMASALDRTGGDGVVAAESHGNSLDEATGPREPWRELIEPTNG